MGGREELGSKAPPASQHSELVEGEEASPRRTPGEGARSWARSWRSAMGLDVRMVCVTWEFLDSPQMS